MSSLATSTTTTSTVTGAFKKGSWFTMAPCRWPEPEKSVGTPHEALDPLGRYNCWSLCDKGPAHLLWKTLSKTIRNLLQEQFEHLDARGSVLHVEIFMIGRKPAKSSPTILFCSENKILRRRAMELVERKVILGRHPGVLVAQSSRLPRLLALGDQVPLCDLPEGVYAEPGLKSPGISIYIVADGSSPRRATIGGFVSIRGEYYGLTTAHAFRESEPRHPKIESEFEFGFSGLGEPDDFSDDEDDLLELTSKGSVSSTSSDVCNSSTSREDELMNSVPSMATISRTAGVGPKTENRPAENTESKSDHSLGLSLVKFGTLYATSSPRTSLDWALVKIDIGSFVSLTRDQETKDKDGWTESACRILNNQIWTEASGKPTLPQISIANKAEDAKVLVCTGMNERPFEGWLSGVSSFTKSPESKLFQELWTVKLEHCSLVDGDCGSWVLDARTGYVYGHVVSGYPTGGSAYLLPASQIVQDIQRQLGHPVEFPIRQYSKNLSSPKGQVGETRIASAARGKPPTQRNAPSRLQEEADGIVTSSSSLGRSGSKTYASAAKQSLMSILSASKQKSTNSVTSSWTNKNVPSSHLQSSSLNIGTGHDTSTSSRSPKVASQSSSTLHEKGGQSNKIPPTPPSPYTRWRQPSNSQPNIPPPPSPPPQSGMVVPRSSGTTTLPIRPPQWPPRITGNNLPNLMDEGTCRKKLTTYAAYTIRKCPPRDPKKDAWGTWARAEVIEKRLAQEDIIKQIKTLSEKGRSVADKKKALAQNMQGQITTLINDLTSKEGLAFEWSVVQLDSYQRPVNSTPPRNSRRPLYETVTMTVYLKRAPLKDLNPVILFQNIEKMNLNDLRSVPPISPPTRELESKLQQQGGEDKSDSRGGTPQGNQPLSATGKDRESFKPSTPSGPRHKTHRYYGHHESDSSSFDSNDSGSDVFSRESSPDRGFNSHSSMSSSSRIQRPSRIRRHKTKYHESSETLKVPDNTHIIPAGTPLPPFDPIAAAYNAGKADADAERFRNIQRPLEPVIERVIEPRAIVSYGRMESRVPGQWCSEPSYDSPYTVDQSPYPDEEEYRLRRSKKYLEAQLDFEARLESLDSRQPSEYVDRRPPDSFYDRKRSEPFIPNNRAYPGSSLEGW